MVKILGNRKDKQIRFEIGKNRREFYFYFGFDSQLKKSNAQLGRFLIDILIKLTFGLTISQLIKNVLNLSA